MWVTTRRGHFSVIQHRDDPRDLLVRTRARVDLENLLAWLVADLSRRGYVHDLDHSTIQEDPRADYRFRLLVDRDEWRNWLADQVDALDYDSHCKENMVAGFDGDPDADRRYRWYLACWQAGHDFQSASSDNGADTDDSSVWDTVGALEWPPTWNGADVVTLSDDMPESEWVEVARAIGGDYVSHRPGGPRIVIGVSDDQYLVASGSTTYYVAGDVLDMVELREKLISDMTMTDEEWSVYSQHLGFDDSTNASYEPLDSDACERPSRQRAASMTFGDLLDSGAGSRRAQIADEDVEDVLSDPPDDWPDDDTLDQSTNL